MSGTEGRVALAARRFAECLARRLETVDVKLWDERLTTAQAERTLIDARVRRRRRREIVDGMAAVLILRSYLDARPPRPGAKP